MAISCRLGWHDWGQFKFLYQADSYEFESDPYPYRRRRIYESLCLKCGDVRIKKVKA